MAQAHVAVVKQEQEEIAKQQQQWQVSGTTIINADGEELQSRKSTLQSFVYGLQHVPQDQLYHSVSSKKYCCVLCKKWVGPNVAHIHKRSSAATILETVEHFMQ